MISRVVLENWKTHHKSEFVFGKGTNVLVGVMGSGKTAVMDAICFGLFGNYPALQSRRISLDETIMAKPSEMGSAGVKIEFDYNGARYCVERTIFKGKKASEAKLFEGTRLVAGPKPTDVTERIESLLEVNYDLFSRAVYSEQNQIDSFLRLSPRERKEKFDELLQIDRYETARANAVNLANQLKRRNEEKKKWLLERKAAFDEKGMLELERRAAEKERLCIETEKKSGLLEKGLVEKESELKRLEQKEKEFALLKEIALKGKARCEEMQKAIAAASKEIDGRSNAAMEKLAVEEKGKIAEAEKCIEGIEAQIEAERKRLEESLQKEKVNESRQKQIEKILKEIGGLGAHCPICKSKLGKKDKERLEKENKEELKALEEENKAIAKEAKKTEELASGLGQKRKSLLREKDALKEKEIKLKELVAAAKRIEKQRKELEDLKQEIEKVERQLKETGFDEKRLLGQREIVAREREEARSLKKEAADCRELAKEIRARLEVIRQGKKQMEETEQEIAFAEKAVEKIVLFSNALVSTQAGLRGVLIEAVNAAMNDVWQKVYPYGDFSSAKMEISGGDYELMVRERSGRWVRVEGILSGGERSAAAICIRIAFSLVLARNLSWLILDEPTHNLDANAVRVLSEMMREHLPGLVEQIFVITHDKQMEKAASASLYLLERNKGEDGITNPLMKEASD